MLFFALSEDTLLLRPEALNIPAPCIELKSLSWTFVCERVWKGSTEGIILRFQYKRNKIYNLC
jgi:hypothetical protein